MTALINGNGFSSINFSMNCLAQLNLHVNTHVDDSLRIGSQGIIGRQRFLFGKLIGSNISDLIDGLAFLITENCQGSFLNTRLITSSKKRVYD